MSTYAVFNYSVTDRDAYGPYLAGVPKTLEEAGAKIIVADFDSDAVEGAPGEVTVVLEFDSREQLDAWYSSPAYEAIKPLRLDNSEGLLVVAEPSGAGED
jgi:uncharacterized protein (DUF1330 family)